MLMSHDAALLVLLGRRHGIVQRLQLLGDGLEAGPLVEAGLPARLHQPPDLRGDRLAHPAQGSFGLGDGMTGFSPPHPS